MGVEMRRKPPVVIRNRKENRPAHLVYADLHTEHGVIRRVLCEVFLPEHESDRLRLAFLPTAKQALSLQHSPSFRMQARFGHPQQRVLISAEDVWMTTHIGSGSHDGIAFVTDFEAKPDSLDIITSFGKGIGKNIIRGVFHLTDSPLVNAASMITRSYTGAVRVRTVVVPSFTLHCGLRLLFKNHYSNTKGSSNEVITTSHLVAEFKTVRPVSRHSFSDAVADLDSFLLILSFASRYRCVCRGWAHSDDRGAYTRHFRQNVTLPTGREPSINDTVVDIVHFAKFMRRSYNYFTRAPHRDVLARSMYALVSERRFLEDSFVRLFSGLESALLHVYRSGGGTNRRIHVKDSFKFFQSKFNVDVSDLWPLFERTSGVPLFDIRNRIAHGEDMGMGETEALSYASENLRWILERVLIAILGWPIQESKVRSDFLRGYLVAHDWLSMITRFRS